MANTWCALPFANIELIANAGINALVSNLEFNFDNLTGNSKLKFEYNLFSLTSQYSQTCTSVGSNVLKGNLYRNYRFKSGETPSEITIMTFDDSLLYRKTVWFEYPV